MSVFDYSIRTEWLRKTTKPYSR